MRAKPPETFGLDRLRTPIGTALLVTDADGILRALDWEDYEPRMKELLRLQYGAVALKAARAPPRPAAALTGYFKGDLDRLNESDGASPARRSSSKVWTALPKIPAGTTMSYGALAAKLGMPRAVRAVGHANGANPHQRRGALSSPDRRQWRAGQIWRRARAQALAAAARRRGDLRRAAPRSRRCRVTRRRSMLSLASRWTSALLIAACRVGAVICAPSRSVT